mmetsp:Transcript_2103/g.5966  ORF Transcript_2103/g.5966 Transcript_2103/m.5966 type:complete len:116 (+) Transcript_2103:177-524(+)
MDVLEKKSCGTTLPEGTPPKKHLARILVVSSLVDQPSHLMLNHSNSTISTSCSAYANKFVPYYIKDLKPILILSITGLLVFNQGHAYQGIVDQRFKHRRQRAIIASHNLHRVIAD